MQLFLPPPGKKRVNQNDFNHCLVVFTLLTYSLLKNIALICSCSPHSLHFATICNVLLVRNSIKSESDWKLMIDFSLRCKFEVDPFNSRIFLANFLIFRQSSACLYEWVFLSACLSICSSYLEVQECMCGSPILCVCSLAHLVWVRPPPIIYWDLLWCTT